MIETNQGSVKPSSADTARPPGRPGARDDFRTIGEATADDPKMQCRNVDVFYGEKQAIFDVSLDIGKNEVISMIGPSGCGKSTVIRCLNRMNDTIESCRVQGDITIDGQNICDEKGRTLGVGYLIEVGQTQQIFTDPRRRLTEDYVTGRFG